MRAGHSLLLVLSLMLSVPDGAPAAGRLGRRGPDLDSLNALWHGAIETSQALSETVKTLKETDPQYQTIDLDKSIECLLYRNLSNKGQPRAPWWRYSTLRDSPEPVVGPRPWNIHYPLSPPLLGPVSRGFAFAPGFGQQLRLERKARELQRLWVGYKKAFLTPETKETHLDLVRLRSALVQACGEPAVTKAEALMVQETP